MKKKVLIGLLGIATAAVMLTGCGGKKDSEEKKEPQEKEEAFEEDFPEEEDAEDGDFFEEEEEEETDTAPETAGVPCLEAWIKSVYETTDDGGTILLKGSYEVPVLTEKSAEEFPELAAALLDAAKTNRSTFRGDIEDEISAAKEQLSEVPESFGDGMFYSDNTKVLPQRVDGKVTSFFYSFSNYTGGAHGMYGQRGETYDTKTGEALALTDILTDTDGFDGIVRGELLEAYGEDFFGDLDEALSSYDPGLTDYSDGGESGEASFAYNWALSPEGLVLYFGPYSLASYAQGAQTVCLSYDKYPELFEEKYLPGESDPFMLRFDFTIEGIDVDGDGKSDSLTIDSKYSDDYSVIEGIDLMVNETESEAFKDVDIWPDSEKYGYYLKTRDGKQYVYVILQRESDYEEVLVFELKDGKARPVDSQWFSRGIRIDEDDDGYFERLLTNPDRMSFATKFDFLSSFTAERNYSVGEDGMPVSGEDYYTLVTDAAPEPLKAKTELDAKVLDDDGAETGEETVIKKGDEFNVIGTDGKSLLDVKLTDGTKLRLSITSVEYPCEINGIVDSDCVEQVWYAG
ncbi:MAG: RsiV family protein [Lachnospiraceae bacterium]|nr:RsiV family protein [Lachnospiraceae bacterium]